jgi:hypothetical protein
VPGPGDHLQPPTRSTGAAADETRPHQGTLRTIRTLGTGARAKVVAKVPPLVRRTRLRYKEK